MRIWRVKIVQQGYMLLKSEWENVVGALNLAFQHQDWEPFVKGLDALTHIHLGVAGFLDAQGYWLIAEGSPKKR